MGFTFPKDTSQRAGAVRVTADGNDFYVPVRNDDIFYRLSTEPKPTILDGAEEGHKLLELDTGEVYVFYKNAWWVI